MDENECCEDVDFAPPDTQAMGDDNSVVDKACSLVMLCLLLFNDFSFWCVRKRNNVPYVSMKITAARSFHCCHEVTSYSRVKYLANIKKDFIETRF